MDNDFTQDGSIQISAGGWLPDVGIAGVSSRSARLADMIFDPGHESWGVRRYDLPDVRRKLVEDIQTHVTAQSRTEIVEWG
jgi:hypothetical protein